jgi:hypothetical protein
VEVEELAIRRDSLLIQVMGRAEHRSPCRPFARYEWNGNVLDEPKRVLLDYLREILDNIGEGIRQFSEKSKT